jgi:hypothetical protein
MAGIALIYSLLECALTTDADIGVGLSATLACSG